MGNNSIKNVKKLKELCSKWDISYKNHFYYINSDHFNIYIYYKDISINRIIDTYNSIDYITEFLLLNVFVKVSYNYCEELFYCYNNETLMIKIILHNNFYFILEYMQFNLIEICNPDKLIEKLRETLNIDARNKLVEQKCSNVEIE